MADKDLIAQQGLLYQSRYYDPSLSFEQPFAKSMGIVQKILSDRKAQKADVESKVASYLENMGEPLNVAKISPKYRNAVNNFLISKRNEYAQAARVAGRYSPTSTAYMESVSKMNSISDAFQQLSTQFDIFKNMKEEDLPDFTNRLVSEGNEPGNLNILTDVLTDKHDIEITENGNISFIGNGNVTELNSLPKYFNKDFKTANKVVNLNKSIYNSGNKLDGASKNFHKLQLKNWITEGGRETLISLATDDFIIDGGLGIDPNLIKDETKHSELMDIVVNQYIDMFDKTAAAGYNQAEAKRKRLDNENNGNDNVFSFNDLTASVRQEVTLRKQDALETKQFAVNIFKKIKDGETNVGAEYIAFMKSRDKNFDATKFITADEHYKLYKAGLSDKDKKKKTEQEIKKAYEEEYGANNYLFKLNKGVTDANFDMDYAPINPFTAENPTQLYRELMLQIGFSFEAIGWYNQQATSSNTSNASNTSNTSNASNTSDTSNASNASDEEGILDIKPE